MTAISNSMLLLHLQKTAVIMCSLSVPSLSSQVKALSKLCLLRAAALGGSRYDR